MLDVHAEIHILPIRKKFVHIEPVRQGHFMRFKIGHLRQCHRQRRAVIRERDRMQFERGRTVLCRSLRRPAETSGKHEQTQRDEAPYIL